MESNALKFVELCVPIIIALIGIIPTVISNGKKTQEAVKEIKISLEDHIQESEWQNAKQVRVRILRFYDEICEGKKHSENHYEDILEDIDWYEAFCDSHPDFHNNKAKMAMEHIKNTYELLKRENKFLEL